MIARQYLPRNLDRPQAEGLLRRLSVAPPLTIIVPVFNGGVGVSNCLYQIVKYAPPTSTILLADDASSDPEVLNTLSDLTADPRVRYMRNKRNLGYTSNVNNAILAAAPDDVLLLNSDARPGPLFAQSLRWVAHGHPSVGTVSAVSNDAATHSLPDPGAYYRGDWNNTARLFLREMLTWAIVAPVAHGFCMYIKRALIDDVGLFDAKAFPQGYNEEIDFSLRAFEAGWDNTIAPRVMVRHLRSRSFGHDTRAELIQRTRHVVSQRYPGWNHDVARWLRSPEWLELKARSSRLHAKASPHIPTGQQMVEETCPDDIRALIDLILDTHVEELRLSPQRAQLLGSVRHMGLPTRVDADD